MKAETNGNFELIAKPLSPYVADPTTFGRFHTPVRSVRNEPNTSDIDASFDTLLAQLKSVGQLERLRAKLANA